MTDEEMAEARATTFADINYNEPDNYGTEKEIGYHAYHCGFLAGLKAGKEMADADLATVAYMQGAERYKPKWHKVADGDLPSEEGGWVCDQDGLPCYYDWGTEQWLDCEGTQIRTTEWCHMPHKE